LAEIIARERKAVMNPGVFAISFVLAFPGSAHPWWFGF
jgi:hypothetical protein